jgi:hypothetical protein
MMSLRSSLAIGRITLALLGLGLAALSIGATEAEYPSLGRGDQGYGEGDCPASTVDGVRVCVPKFEATAGVTVVTVAPGLSIVE